MPVTKKDLPNVQGRKLESGGYQEAVRPVLYCRSCGDTYSATPGDYWNADAGKVLTCDTCGEPLELAHKLTVYVPWAQRDKAVSAVRGVIAWPETGGE